MLVVDPVDYNDTFIAVAGDSAATVSTVPSAKPESPSVASRTFAMIWRLPYKYTSGELIERWTLLPDGLALLEGKAVAGLRAGLPSAGVSTQASRCRG